MSVENQGELAANQQAPAQQVRGQQATDRDYSPIEQESLREATRRYRQGRGSDLTEGELAHIRARVEELKREQNAVVLAHYYVPAETQALADYVGDSFYLARLAKTLECDTIVLAGVSFMCESVKLLNPARRVLNPEPHAHCPMAYMVRKQDVDKVREQYGDDLAVVDYINSTAEIKTWSDVCVTSSNAVKVISELPQHNILFIPDMNLGRYVAEQLPDKNVILNRGYCPTHNRIIPAEVEALELAHPEAEVCAHPECTREILDEADYIGSTKQIIEHIAASDAREFIVLTVVGVAAEIERQTAGQGKRIYFPATPPICPNMAMVGPEKVLAALETGAGEVELPANAEGAMAPLERMLELAAR